jgi:hypothetical protein
VPKNICFCPKNEIIGRFGVISETIEIEIYRCCYFKTYVDQGATILPKSQFVPNIKLQFWQVNVLLLSVEIFDIHC